MKWLSAFVGVALASIFAFVIFEFVRLQHCGQVSYGLDFGSVFDALVLLVIGILIEYAYLKRSSEKQADNELLLAVVDDAKKAFTGLSKQADACQSGKALTKRERESLVSAERELSNAVHSIETACGHCKIKPEKIQLQGVKDARSALRDALTDTPYPGPYDSRNISSIRTSSKTMQDELTRIAFAINHR